MPTTAPDGPGVDPVQVGAITFRTTEAPTRIGLGAGKHDVAVTEYPGGGRDVKAMGAQPKTVTLKVQLWNPGIDDNLDLLQAYMALGREVYVSWRAERYYAIITDFTPEWHNKNRVDVELIFEITRDDNGVFSDATDESVDDKVMALLGTAAQTNVQVLSLPQPEPPTPDYSGIQIQGQGGGTGNAFAPAMAGGTSPSVSVLAPPTPISPQTFQQALTNLRAAVSNAGPIAQLSGNALATVQNAVQAAIDGVTAYVNSLPAGCDPLLPAQTLLDTLTLVQKNVARGQAPQSVRQQGGDLWTRSVLAYGSIDYAFALAHVNDLPCIILPANESVVLVLPAYTKAA
jgi:hypothetical protein